MKHPDGSISCSKCDKKLTPDNASPYNFRTTNRQTHTCRACQAARQSLSYRENPRVREYLTQYTREHPEYARAYYQRNRKRILAAQRAWRKANPEAARAQAHKAYLRRKARAANA